jgi:AP-1 complex subunit gamma-1
MSIKLRDLIRNVRAAKTAAEERAVITKECALIRTAFKEQHQMSSSLRSRNVAKLLFIHMLGYPSHFGQMETMKLVSAGNFAEKRMGYLALQLLMDETHEVLMLVTNSIKNDLKSNNQYIVGIALSALGNVGSEHMMRDLATEVDTHLRNSTPFIRKKAALCAMRTFEKVPELVADMAERISMLINDRNHAVFLTGVFLIQHVMERHPEHAKMFRRLSIVKKLVKRLMALVRSGYQPEYDIAGITDPFLQVAIIRVLRLLGEGSDELSEAMSDILAQVATNTETNKNTGNAILYECVLTIMHIRSESGLRVLAINLLGRFLLNNDNNIRYVALNTLSKVAHRDIGAVSRHRNTIVDCLKDPDISIRRRAMELIYSLVNESNVQPLAREMLNYLVVADTEFKRDLCTRIAEVVRKFAPSPRWHIDTLMTMLSIAGKHASDEITACLIMLVSKNQNLQPYCVHKFYGMIQEDLTQEGLTYAGIWCIGEYGEHLLSAPAELPDAEPAEERRVLDVLEKAMKAYFSTETMKAMSLTALVKLSTRFSEPASAKRIKRLLRTFSSSLRLELQQRSVEYTSILGGPMDGIRPKILDRMPVIPDMAGRRRKRMSQGGAGSGSEEDSSEEESGESGEESEEDLMGGGGGGSAQNGAGSSHGDDLLGDLLGGSPAPSPKRGGGGAPPGGSPGGGGEDLMADLFGGGGGDAMAASNGGGSMDDMFGGGMDVAAPAKQFPDTVAFEKNGIKLVFSYEKPQGPDSGTTLCTMTATNSNDSDARGFVVHAAVPKFLKISWQPASGNVLGARGSSAVTQTMQIDNSAHGVKKIIMRLKIECTINGRASTEMAQVNNFPQGL